MTVLYIFRLYKNSSKMFLYKYLFIVCILFVCLSVYFCSARVFLFCLYITICTNNTKYHTSISNIHNYSTVTLIRCMEHFSYVFLSCFIKTGRRSAVKTKCNEPFQIYCLTLLRISVLICMHFFFYIKK